MKIVFFAIALAVNCVGCFLAGMFHIPLYLDSVMTIGVVALCGLFPGILCAIFSNLILAFTGYAALPFTICHILTAIASYFTFRHCKNTGKDFLTLEAFLWAGLWSGILNGISGNIISDLLYASVTGVQKADFMVKGIYIAIENLTVATYITGIVENLCDKSVSAVLSFFFTQFFRHFTRRLGD